jgi:hypothetical protein
VTATHATATSAETVAVAPAAAPAVAGPSASATAVGALHVLAPAALLILLVCALLVVFGWSEALETRQWLLAFAVALPGGVVIAGRQARGIDEAQAAWAVAAAAIVLGFALVLRRAGSGDTLHHALVGIAAAAALAAPWLVRRRVLGTATAGYTTAMVALAVTSLLFIPDGALRSGRLVPALLLAAVTLVALLATAGREPPPRLRVALDVVVAGTLALVVMTVPDIRAAGDVVAHHQDFYLGPVNAVIHGRPMLAGTWAQYGVGVMDALRLMFAVVPIGYGGLSLIVVGLTAAQYALVYVTLRMAIRSQLLVGAILGAEIVAHLLGLDVAYFAVPSTSPLRFGLPYLVIALAVLAARHPSRARRARIAQLVVLAVSAVWSFEAFVYTAATFGLIVLVTEVAAGPGALRRVLRAGLAAVAVSAAAVIAYTLLVIARSGGADWGPYLDYLKLYSVRGFGQMPIIFFSPGPVMGAVIFGSVAGTIHLARTRSPAATPEQLAALAGFSGAAAAFYTYYLGRSHPDNLLNILLPTVVLGGLWAALLLQARPSPARLAGLGALLTAAAMLAVGGWPFAKIRWQDTAFAQAVPYADGKPPGQGRSLVFALKRMWHDPVFDPRAASAVALLNRHLPPGAPALVLTEPDLTTEILVHGHRRNLLPISTPIEDDLIDSSDVLVRNAAREVPAGTLMLTTPPPKIPGQAAPNDNPPDFVGVQVVALDILHARFAFHRVETTRDGLQLVRLQPHRAAPTAAQRKTGRPTP